MDSLHPLQVATALLPSDRHQGEEVLLPPAILPLLPSIAPAYLSVISGKAVAVVPLEYYIDLITSSTMAANITLVPDPSAASADIAASATMPQISATSAIDMPTEEGPSLTANDSHAMTQVARPSHRRVKVACSNCHDARKPCDRGRPCGRCQKMAQRSGMSVTCVDHERKRAGARTSGSQTGRTFGQAANTDQGMPPAIETAGDVPTSSQYQPGVGFALMGPGDAAVPGFFASNEFGSDLFVPPFY